ncbi:efflux RND transporter periplasmic adaptor subunit [Fulvivirgaceae bacterium BMA10]|uniref:Efflux RND transporter periplasmic adaptor subunit n=1 Tax=Splendidivirga corallicola TaxID=3051826 RepID=A0ABT8KX22_9BACT|nr:efflux RND transporter periplasmic adaptor subunit [Fulvivirgaceae bacterium BMA10]
MATRRIIIVLIGLGIIVGSIFIMGALVSMKKDPEKKTQAEIKRYVKTEPVRYSNINTEIAAYGRVRTAESLDLIAEVSGRMFAGPFPLKEGQRFKRGDLLFRIDDTESKLNLQSQKSNFLRDLAAILPDLKIDFSENYTQWNSYFESIDLNKSLPELPAYKSQKEKTFLATKSIFSNYYSIKSAEANLRKYHFYAPFDGNISLVNLQSGSYVNPGNNIGRIIRSGRLELKVAVETKDIGWIQKGTNVKVNAENSDVPWKGIITRIGEFVNQNTQSIDVFIAIEPNGNALYDGQYLKSAIPAKSIERGMIIPRNAIFNENEVFVLQDTVLKVRRINIHKLNPETVVFSGLEEGLDLVTEPLVNAHNNMKAYKLEEKKDINLEKKVVDTQTVKSSNP